MTDVQSRILPRPLPKPSGCWPGFWVGIGGALLTALFAMMLLPGLTMVDYQRQLEARANAALKVEGMGWARVVMDGQRATLSGAAPTDDAQKRAAAIVLTSSGAGGDYAGGVTRVINSSIVGSAVSPYTWSIRRTANGVQLAGHVPNEAARARLRQSARQLFSVDAEDIMRTAPGEPGGEWARVAELGIDAVAKLRRGEARLVNQRLLIIGEGTQDAVAQIRARASMGPAPGYELRADVSVEGQGLAIPELKGVDLTNATPEACTQAFGRLMDAKVINFALNQDTIEARSYPLLDNLVSVAVRCDTARIEVSGHTDATGDAGANLELSQRRANAVRRYLIDRGVLDSRIVAQGFGAARPIASNAAADGQARNRRIEFRVAAP
jgi:OmpA-OmpF porin, OOP family